MTQSMKEIIEKLVVTKIINFCYAKDNAMRIKQMTDWEKIFCKRHI